ncbi:hypothetical protein ACFWB1_19485 [Streptomyces goshikiensis]|uniref:hypothetical protein n=1 Tax=Streptomyces goshikiensis TaxID=1942 RepID=UPI0036A42557
MSLLSPLGHTRKDVELPSGELGESIKTQFAEGENLRIIVITAMGKTAAKSS